MTRRKGKFGKRSLEDTHLHITFGNVEGGHAGMSEAACKSATDHADGVVPTVMGDRIAIPGSLDVRPLCESTTRIDDLPGIPLDRGSEVSHELKKPV